MNTSASTILSANGLCKSYHMPSGRLDVLHDVSLDLKAGEQLAITGASGSGKTTLLSLLAGLDAPDRGTITLAGQRIESLGEDEWARMRGKWMGIVFQKFHLIPSLTALENVALPLHILEDQRAEEKAAALLAQVGLGDRAHHLPRELSGGESQRVAIARALAPAPRLILADEPSGNLDTKTGEYVMDMLFKLSSEHGAALALVTHDLTLAKRCGRQIVLQQGRVVSA